MTGSRPDPDDPHQGDDVDPTGVRSLLANLPAPGPMPDELVKRITASLELEQQRRADSPGVISLDAERQRRRPGRTVLWLGGAAAVAMVATLSVNQLTDGDGGAGVSAQVPAADSANAGSDAGTEELDGALDRGSTGDDLGAMPNHPAAEAPLPGDVSGEGAEGADEVGASDGAGDSAAATLSVFSADGTIGLSPSQWDDQVSSWVAGAPDRGTSSWTSRDALDCVTTHDLAVGEAGQLLMSDARWDEAPAMLLVAQEPQGAGTAWVVSPDCSTVLSGPLALPR